MKLKNGIEIEELMAGRARVRLRMPFGASYSVKDLSPEAMAQMASLAARRTALQDEATPSTDLTFDQVNPVESDYIFPLFRALSSDLIDGYFLDFRTEGVVKAAAPLLQGQTVYTNHRYWDVERWVGVVNVAEWDAKGEKSGGIAGINVELKIDWKMSPRIARGLLMKPPAIHSVSATILFEWDASHPDLLEKGIFWASLGEEVDGEIVRLIVTKILGFWELSLVFQGADTNAKQLPGDEEEENELAARRRPSHVDRPSHIDNVLDAHLSGSRPSSKLSLISKEKKTVKLTAEQKKRLGLEAHEGDEIADAIVTAAMDSRFASFETRIANATAIIDADRAEVLRLATIAESGADGKLSEALQAMLAKADAAQLPALKQLYAERAEAKFTKRCQKCGSTEIANRSSVEEAPVVQQTASHVAEVSIL